MLDAGLEIHSWLWRSIFALPIVLMGLYRLVERRERLGKEGWQSFLTSGVYVGLIALAIPFFLTALDAIPIYRHPPMGRLPQNARYVAAFFIFALLWLQPEVERFKILRGVTKLAALYVGLLVIAPNAILPGSAGLPPTGAATRAVAFLFNVWSLTAAAVFALYAFRLRPQTGRWAASAIVAILTVMSFTMLSFALAAPIAILLLASYPLLLAVGPRDWLDVKAMSVRDLYRAGLELVPFVGHVDEES